MLEWIETPKRAHLVLEIANMGNLAEYIKRVCSSSHPKHLVSRSTPSCTLSVTSA